jgi:tetratricopeptide (TPR) repeat protein
MDTRKTVWMPLLKIALVAALAAFGAYKFFRNDSARDPSRKTLTGVPTVVETVREMARDPDKYQQELAARRAHAKRELDAKIAGEPGNAQLLIDRGRAAHDAGDYDAALRDIDAAMRLDSSREYYLLFLRHRALDGLGRQEEALTVVLEAIRSAPPGAEYERFAADLHRRLGDPGAGVLVFDESIRREPDNLWLLARRAQYLATIGRFDEAVIDITDSIRREREEDPRRMRSIRRIDILTAARRFDEALADANLYISRYPTDTLGFGFRSKIHEAMGNHRQAKIDRDQATSLGPIGQR